MKTVFIAILLAVLTVSNALAGSLGVRVGGTTIHSGYQSEVYGRFEGGKYMMAEVSWGVGYLDGYIVKGVPVTDHQQYPFNGVLGIRVPLGNAAVYAAGGGSFIPSEYRVPYGSPVFQAGVEIPLSSRVYISADYRHQFNDPTNFWFGGLGSRF